MKTLTDARTLARQLREAGTSHDEAEGIMLDRLDEFDADADDVMAVLDRAYGR